MRHRQQLGGICAAIGMGILILDSRTALEGAQQGVALCIRSLIPSLFPFLVLSSLLTSSFMGAKNILLRPLGKLFGIPAGCESLLIPGFLGGYPAGAQCIGQSCRQGCINTDQAQRMLSFCSNAGPSFLFGLLGPMFPRRGMLWQLWMVHIASALLCAHIFSVPDRRAGSVTHMERSISEILTASVKTMGTVCGWVVLFRVVLAFCSRWFLRRFPPLFQTIAAGVLELSNGCLSLASIPDPRMRFVTAAGLLAFGGVCVVMQTSSVIAGLSMVPYLRGKLLQCIFSVLLSTAMVYHQPIALAVLVLFWVILKKTVAFRTSMVYNGSITSRRKPYAVSKENRPRLRVLSPGHSSGRGPDPLQQKGPARTG